MALRTLRAGLMSGVTSPSRPWFRLGLLGSSADEVEFDVKDWLHEVQRRMYEIMSGSNIYRMLDSSYGDLGLYGTAANLVVHDFEDVVRGHSLPVGRFKIGEDGSGRVTSLYREIEMPVRGIVESWGLDSCSAQVRRDFDRGEYYKTYTVCHMVDKRADGDAGAPKASGRPWASVYWEMSQQNKFLQIGGHRIKPLLAPRWEQVEGEAWSASSPGMIALGDARSLQVSQEQKAIAIQKMHNPPLIGGPIQGAMFFENVPGGFTAMASTDLSQGSVRPAYEVKPDIQGLILDILETQQRIEVAFTMDLFQMAAVALEGRSQITAREIADRHEEKLMALGPVLESLDHELLQPLIEAKFAYMQEADILPDAPESVVGQEIKIEYISLLAQAQKAIGVGSIERTIGFAGTLAQLKPEVLDMLDSDQMMREFADQVGAPPGILLSPDELTAKREAGRQASQQEQMMAVAEPMAGAAKLLSKANLNGIDALQRGAAL
ncbi:portal protein [Paracoccus litorisediminis]|uniref:Phage head-tail adapter protein n=1 Tax=Paracoccus litorisediminis TaxID=2006130 RepID=A0A844HL43_9RHOB|nr:portal protein [Paracoccus litorisediminis]MTH60973.1 phage head-tail adapter protein [Paracoccus litorisediminis]